MLYAVQLVRAVFVRHCDFHLSFWRAQTTVYLWWGKNLFFFSFFTNRELQFITDIYNSLQLNVIIDYWNLSYIKTSEQRGKKTRKQEKKVERQSPQNDHDNKLKKVACWALFKVAHFFLKEVTLYRKLHSVPQFPWRRTSWMYICII